MSANNWYVITGGPSSGKTTLLMELAKLGHKTIPEAARTVIDEAVNKGLSVEQLRADEKRFQEDVARLKQNIETTHDSNELTFFDRGMHDTLAYFRHYGFNVEKWIAELLSHSSYRKVFLLEPLSFYHKDYARTESFDFTESIHKLLHDAYTEFGMEPVLVKAMDPPSRAEFVLNNLNMEQP